MKSFTFLVHNIYHMGGTTKSISNLANILSEKGHRVKIISVFKASTQPYFKLNKDIEIIPIIEYAKTPQGLINILFNRIHKYTPFLKPKIINKNEPGLNQFSSYVENKIIKKLQQIDTDIVVGTRASYNLLIAQYVEEHIIKIGMEHMYLNAHPKSYQQDIIKGYENLNIVTTLTKDDQQDYKKQLKNPHIIVVSNILNEPKYDIPKKNVIVAAGRFDYEKGFDLLIESINLIQEDMRKYDYVLELYGDGQEKETYINLINKFNVGDIIKLRPTTNELSKVLASSKITAVPSRVEGFGLVILEAMYQQNIVIGYQGCYGPEFLIEHNVNGYLIPSNDIIKFSNRIIEVIEHYDSIEIQSVINESEIRTKQFDKNEIYSKFLNDIEGLFEQ
ncbi:glycoside hydrolase [Mammaliicoccus stepanovicii]|uniref:Glycosyle transferase group I protein n=1 Tax=Mammaliicoccus stepanovicii TaxID=643214 RepID=A0A239ZQ19_9STAP|nr:glycosyltransferase [Mammaliicoccus stepanovicii]PNZ73700.1 glycosyltransferase family 4 protein [Mammaliicoccus stepanovicii]GGI43418.1 glycoside hydrolase [Mammaliicoccus stepanovicii]SNV73411.1 glycosyle transferase group I protein [Mammaliicoccus stepanovicii]